MSSACPSACLTTGFFTSGTGTNATCVACAAGASACSSLTNSTACFTSSYYLTGTTCVALTAGAKSVGTP